MFHWNEIIPFFEQLLFIVQLSWILTTESCVYMYTQNYSYFLERTTTQLASINILYVKVFQAIALNNHLLDEKNNAILLKFTDNVPWNYSDINFDLLLNLMDEYDLYLTNIEKPMKSGMISLVYKAYKIGTNDCMILKVKRANIEEKLNKGIHNLLFCVKLLSFIPAVNKYNINETVTKTIQSIITQTNFNLEVEHMMTIRENCKNLKYIKIPYAIPEITEKYHDVIVMEYIDGITIDQLEPQDYEKFAEPIIKFGIVSTVVHGITHGDLHAGNILFIKDTDKDTDKDNKYKYKIGLLDFGIVYELNKKFKETWINLCLNYITLPSSEIAKLILSYTIEPYHVFNSIPKEHSNKLISMASSLIEDIKQKSKKANQIQLYKFLYDFNNYLSNNYLLSLGLRLSEEFVRMQMSIAMSHGITITLCKDNYVAVTDRILNELFHLDLLDIEEE